MKSPLLKLSDVLASVEKKQILNLCNFSVLAGTTHFLMGANGAGKSSLARVIIGHPKYTLSSGDIIFDGKSISELPMYKRARLGIFLAVQAPPTIEGVSIFSLLKESYRSISESNISLLDLHEKVLACCDLLKVDHSFLDKGLNDGFSGGERKKIELLQLLVLKPKFAILDEIDSGLDVDSSTLVSVVLEKMRKENPEFSCLIISHTTRLLQNIVVDRVHVMKDGKIIESGSSELAYEIEKKGYDGLVKK